MFIAIRGVKPYDGRYELNLEAEWTARELGWIKRLAGYLPQDMAKDGVESDAELWCVMAAVAMRRTGRIQPSEVPGVFDRLIDAPFGTAITLEPDPEPAEVEVEAAPDPLPASSSSPAPTSGNGSPTSSGTLAPHPSPTGIPGLGTSASGLAMLAT